MQLEGVCFLKKRGVFPVLIEWHDPPKDTMFYP